MQSNVITRPIYLAPIIKDGTETNITNGAAATVTNPKIPGVALDIPPGAITFPNGSNSGAITISSLPATRSTIKPLHVAQPTSVLALEPSGTTFSQPITLTLPNDNDLPAGTDLVILSMNSTKGVWELGAIARVSDDGRSVVTKPGLGLLHFSIIYDTPIGPNYAEKRPQDKPGVDTFNGAMSTSITLPSYKSLGQSIAPSLTYKSNWAHPNALVSNVFDVPRNDIYSSDWSGWQVDGGHVSNTIVSHGWIEPEYVESKFFSTAGVISDWMRWTGVPNQSTVSYSFDLKSDPRKDQYVSSGIYPYYSRWNVKLRQVLITSWISHMLPDDDPVYVITQGSRTQTREIQKLFPSDLQGTLYVQNYVNSAAGRGWRIGGVQSIVNPQSNRIMIEEGDGATAAYALNNTIDTVFDAAKANVDLNRGAGLAQYPTVIVTGTDRGVKTVDFTDPLNPSVANNASLPANFNASIAGSDLYYGIWAGQYTFWGSIIKSYSIKAPRKIGQYFASPDGRIFATDNGASQVYSISDGQVNTLAGRSSDARAPSFVSPNRGINWELYPCENRSYVNAATWDPIQPPLREAFFWPPLDQGPLHIDARTAATNFCNANAGSYCDSPHTYASMDQAFTDQVGADYYSPWTYGTYTYEDQMPPLDSDQARYPVCSRGTYPMPNFNGDGQASLVAVSSPMGLIAGPRPNTLLFADTGHHLVRLIDLTANTIQTFAGNGLTVDSGDGGQALNSGIRHPRGLVYDEQGNLYIASEKLIRKITPDGIITTFAGTLNPNNDSYGESVPANNVALDNATGIAIDKDNGYLYVAVTDQDIVRRIDFATMTATIVAGINNNSGFSGDGGPALQATLTGPTWVAVDSDHNLIIADVGNQRIRKVTFQAGASGALSYGPVAQDHTTLSRNSDGTWTRTYRNGNQVFFDAQGHQISSVDRVGRTATYSYDGYGRLERVHDPSGRDTIYAYTGSHLFSITDPVGRVTYFDYDGDYLIRARFPDGSKKEFTYDKTRGLMTDETNERGFQTTYAYNDWFRLASVTKPGPNAAKPTVQVTINDSGSATASNNYTGGATGRFKSDGSADGQVYDGITNPKSVTTKFVSAETGYTTTIIDGKDRKTFIDRDTKGRPTKITRPDNTFATFKYDPTWDDLVEKTDLATGLTVTQTYDQWGNLTAETNNTQSNSFTFYPNGLIKTKTNTLNQTATYAYWDGTGLIKTITTARGTTQYFHDAAGNKTKVIDPAGFVVTYTYDAAGNLTSTTRGETTYSYEYDEWNRLKSVTSPNAQGAVDKTTYAYYETGELKHVIDALGNKTQYEYNGMGLVTKKIDQLGFETIRDYDESGNLVYEKDPNGNVKTFAYDNFDQLQSKTLPDNAFTFGYNDRGKITSITNNQSQLTIEYDDASRIVTSTSTGRGDLSSLPATALTFGYDAFGNRSSLTDSVGATSYGYDGLGRLTSLTNPKSETFSFTYDDSLGRVTLTRPGSVGSTQIDTLVNGSLQKIAHSSSGGVISSYDFAWNPDGTLSKVTNKDLIDRIFSYNKKNELTKDTNPEAGLENFEYDLIDNRVTDNGGSYNYDDKKQKLLSDYRYIYVHDNNGNLVNKQSVNLGPEAYNYIYSSENQLIRYEAYLSGQLVKKAEYFYDALSRRVRKHVVEYSSGLVAKETTRNFGYDGSNLILEYDGNNQLLARYTYTLGTDDVLSADITDAGKNAGLAYARDSYFYLKDAVGSVIDVQNSVGIRVQHYTYSSFGKIAAVQSFIGGVAQPIFTAFTFTGREFDAETNNYYYRARYYDPSLGRFLQKDPHPGNASVPVSVINGYAYAGNNSITNTDPTGMSFLGIDWGDVWNGIKGAIAGAVLGGVVGEAIGAWAGFTKQISEATINKILVIEGIAMAAALTGGAAGGAVGGGFWGSMAGSAVGGLTGGAIGGMSSGALGMSGFNEGFWFGFKVGAFVGGIAGYYASGGASERTMLAMRDRSETDYEYFEMRRAADAYGPQEYIEPGMMRPRFPVPNPNCVPIMGVPAPGLPGLLLKAAACFIFG